jgi:hypothetical protein
MKTLLPIPIVMACALWTQAQGTLQFRATLTGSQVVPPHSDPTAALADFWLTGNVLDFYIAVPAITFTTDRGTINGPALPGSLAPVIFDLGGFVFHSGSTLGDPPTYSSGSPAIGPFGAGPFTLTTDQISQLQAGLWYVQITSFTMPDGQLRGQILPVPEPSVWGLVGTGGLLFWWYGRRKEKG